MEPRVGDKSDRIHLDLCGLALGFQPAQKGMMHHARGMTEAARFSPDHGAQNAFGDEKGHLRIVRDGTDPAKMRNEAHMPLRKVGSDLGQRPEFNLRTHCIADRAAHQASPAARSHI